jgi:alpha-L-fucosidase
MNLRLIARWRNRFFCASVVGLALMTNMHAQTVSSKYEPSWESLKRYETPDWFRDAKFGIFIHWGVYSVPAFGNEWYAREMYTNGSESFTHHVSTYGPQSKFGYKDFIPKFRAEKWDPDAWAELFVQSGAKYVVPVAEHHDGFAMYDCSLSRWNAVQMGPKRDIVGELATAVRKKGLIFGLSSHRAEHWWFMNQGKLFDSDVNDSAYADLYGPARLETEQPDKAHLDNWYARCMELVNKYHPDLFWFDWWIEQPAFAPYLQRFTADYYNEAAKWGKEVVINYKYAAFADHTAVLDIERGRLDETRMLPWQTDTSIGKKSWGYIVGEENKSPNEIVDELADIVSKNGCLLLNIGPKPDGTISDEQQQVLRDIGAWLKVNGEAIYNTRPWVVAGEGTTQQGQEGMFSEQRGQPYTFEDIRFTTRDGYVYAIILAWPGASCQIRNIRPDPDSRINLLGYGRALEWKWDDQTGLRVNMPADLQQEERRPCKYAYVLKVKGKAVPVLPRPSILVGNEVAGGACIFTDTVAVQLRSEQPGAQVFFTLDGTPPSAKSTRYTGPFMVSVSATLRAIAMSTGFVQSLPAQAVLRRTKVTNIKSISYKNPYSSKHHADGDLTLLDGERGSNNLDDGRWLGFESTDADMIIELSEPRQVHSVSVGCLQNQSSWIFLPQAVDIDVSQDGKVFHTAARFDAGQAIESSAVEHKEFSLTIGGDPVRFLRIHAANVGTCPPWHKGAGGKAWLFLDEVVFN